MLYYCTYTICVIRVVCVLMQIDGLMSALKATCSLVITQILYYMLDQVVIMWTPSFCVSKVLRAAFYSTERAVKQIVHDL